MKFLAIDIGASSGRHITAELTGGKLVLDEIYRFPNCAHGVGGRLFWDIEELFRHIIAGLKIAGASGSPPDRVGIDTWAVDYVLLDKADRASEVYSYRDRRGGAVKDKAHVIMPFNELYTRTGIQYQPFNTLYQLFDDKLGGRLAGAESFLMLPDYFDYRLTGVKKQEYTNATSTGMVNAVTHRWDTRIIDAFGLPPKLFGELTQPGAKVGEFTDAIAAEVGYRATVMLPATHDTASAVLAAPIGANKPYISSGTWSLLGVEQPAARTDYGSMRCNYSNEGGTGGSFRFQKNIMGLWMIQRVRAELDDKYSFDELAEMARGCAHGKVVDVNDEKFLAPESMLDAIWSETGMMSVGETAYCVYNSLAKCYAQALAELEKLTGCRSDTLNIIGGGSKNALLNELTARETGKRVITGPVESTAVGNIIMQMIGAGVLPDLDAARQVVAASFDIEEVL